MDSSDLRNYVCWIEAPDGTNCDRMKHHSGKHTWELMLVNKQQVLL